MELYDKDGNVIEGALSKEEAESAQAAAVEAAKTAAVEEYKTANPTETPEEKAAREAREKAEKGDKTPAELASEAATAAVNAAMRARDIKEMARLYAPDDTEKQKAIIENATSKVTGFADDEQGLNGLMEAAASMAGVNTAGVDIASLSHTGGGRNVDLKPGAATTENDASIQKGLGISKEDAEKYGGEEAKA